MNDARIAVDALMDNGVSPAEIIRAVGARLMEIGLD
jgi:hypothetical protein